MAKVKLPQKQVPLTAKNNRMTVPPALVAECLEAGNPERRSWQNVAVLLLERGLAQFKRDSKLIEGGRAIEALRGRKIGGGH